MHQAESSSSLSCLWTGLSLPVALHPASRRRSYLPLRTGQCSRPIGTFTLLLVRTSQAHSSSPFGATNNPGTALPRPGARTRFSWTVSSAPSGLDHLQLVFAEFDHPESELVRFFCQGDAIVPPWQISPSQPNAEQWLYSIMIRRMPSPKFLRAHRLLGKSEG